MTTMTTNHRCTMPTAPSNARIGDRWVCSACGAEWGVVRLPAAERIDLTGNTVLREAIDGTLYQPVPKDRGW